MTIYIGHNQPKNPHWGDTWLNLSKPSHMNDRDFLLYWYLWNINYEINWVYTGFISTKELIEKYGRVKK